jgi:hypothetical protein
VRAYLEIAVGVQQQVRRLQVAVQHVGRVEGLERAQRLRTNTIGSRPSAAPPRGVGKASRRSARTHLVDKVLAVVVAQLLRADHAVQVRLHQLLHEVHLPEVRERRRLEDVEDRDHVLVPEVAQQPDLAQRAEAEHRVVERRDALDRDLARRGRVQRRPASRGGVSQMRKNRTEGRNRAMGAGAGAGMEMRTWIWGDAHDDAVGALADDVEDLVVGADDKARQSVVHRGAGIRGRGRARARSAALADWRARMWPGAGARAICLGSSRRTDQTR